jgi:hypothetical protein
MLSGHLDQTNFSRHGAANQYRNTDPLRLRTRDQRGIQATHIDRDEAMGVGVHETNGGKRSACETGGRTPISALTYAFICVANRGHLTDDFERRIVATSDDSARLVNLSDRSPTGNGTNRNARESPGLYPNRSNCQSE